MIVSKFEPKECPQLTAVIHELIINRQLKAMSSKTVRPQLPFSQSTAVKFKEFEQTKPVNVKPEVIRTIVRKQKRKNDIKSELKAHQKYKQWLVNYLHKTSRIEMIRGVLPISMLGSIEEPVYPGLAEGTPYRKDFPHHSNIIRPTDIHHEQSNRVIFVRSLRRPENPEQLGSTFQNTSMKIATVIRFIFKFLKSRAEHFEEIAEELNESVRNIKLLFDVLSVAFKLEKEHEKLERLRQRQKTFREQYHAVCRSYRQRIESLVQTKEPGSALIPREQMWISLKELHDFIIEYEYS